MTIYQNISKYIQLYTTYQKIYKYMQNTKTTDQQQKGATKTSLYSLIHTSCNSDINKIKKNIGS